MLMTRITKARKSHVPGIVELWKEFMDYHAAMDPFFTRSTGGHKKFKDFISKSFGSGKTQLFVALDGNNIIGFSYAHIMKYPPVFSIAKFGFISDMAITKKYRRHGIGRRLLAETMTWLKKTGVKRVELTVAAKNRIGCSFWEKAGFKEYMKREYIEL